MSRLYSLFYQLLVKAFSARILMVLSRGTFVNKEETLYDTRMSSSLTIVLTFVLSTFAHLF